MALLGGLLSGVRAGAHRSPLAGGAFDAPESVTVTTPAFTDGGAMPRSGAGKGVGDNISPPLRWDGQPPETQQLVLVIDDIDVPLPRPLQHTVAVIEPGIDGVAAGALQPGTSGMRFSEPIWATTAMQDHARSPATACIATGSTCSRSIRPSPTA